MDRNRVGCRTHSDAGCQDLRLSNIREVLLRTEYTISEYGNNLVQQQKWGYPCNNLTDKDFNRLLAYRDTIKRYYDAVREDYDKCLSFTEIQRVLEKARKLNETVACGTEIDNQEVDVSQFDVHAECIAYEPWERAMYLRMPEFSVNVELKECLRFAFDLRVTLDREIFSDFLYELSVKIKEACSINYEVAVDNHECQIEYETIVKSADCDIDFDTYVTLKECGLSYELISDLAECGVSARYDRVNDEIYFDTIQGNTYDITDLKSLDKIKL